MEPNYFGFRISDFGFSLRLLPYRWLLFACLFSAAPVAAQKAEDVSLLVKAEAGTIVWVGNLRYGTVPEDGALPLRNLPAGAHRLRARLPGKREITQVVPTKADKTVTLQLTFKLPASPAEQSFQNAEALREKGQHKDAIPAYQTALKLSKTAYTAARIGLARSLLATSEYNAALDEARRAARDSAAAAEATTVLANTFRAQGLYDEAFEHYRKALSLARNVSPEAHTGLALTYQEENQMAEAIQHLRTAATQANDTEPIIYYLLGSLLDREGQIKEAITAYEKFLLLEPNSKYAATTRALLKQLKREAH